MNQLTLETPDSGFAQLVRGALTHLYDPAYLQNHPLVRLLDLDTRCDEATRSQRLRRILIECIESLVPGTRQHDQAKAKRAYTILTGRYIEGLSIEEIGQELGLSERQLYREHKRGLEAVVSLLWDRVQEVAGSSREATPIGPKVADNRLEAVRTELDRLQPSVHVERLDVRPILQSVLDLLRPLIEQSGSKVRVMASSPSVSTTVVADRVLLRQSLVSLLSHALHVTQEDLSITLDPGENGLFLELTGSPAIGRSGALVPPPARKPDDVGLMVAQAMIEAQGGRLEIDDSLGFWRASVSLPTREEVTVLVVEDNQDVVALFRRYLAGHRVNVVASPDGEQAIRLAAELRPNAITLDVMMPGEDGWEVLQRLKSRGDTRHIPVIVCSVLNEPDVAIATGASSFVSKPVNRIELLEALSRSLGPSLRSA